MSENELVLGDKIGCVGQITLNRPQAINALNDTMLAAVHDILARWIDDDAVRLIVLRGAGERGFCAGGDVRSVREVVASGDIDDAATYFRDEYLVDHHVAQYPKPIVALMHGVTMGGGVGLAGQADIRVVTETSKVAMPETRIGFTPDVGGTFLLAHAPGRLGEYYGLTGDSMNAGEAIACGFADVAVPEASLDALVEALAASGEDELARDVVARFAEEPPATHLDQDRAWIDPAFSGETVRDILDALALRTERRAVRAYTQLRQLSPTALALTLDAVREARTYSTVPEALTGEYRRVMWMLQNSSDFLEGVRAVLIDKTGDPAWSPTLREVDDWSALAAGARTFTPSLALFD